MKSYVQSVPAKSVFGVGSALFAAGLLSAGSASAATFVSTELVLAVDVSGSVSTSEFNLQRDGYVNAFRDAGIISQIEGLTGGIAVSLVYWSTSATQATSWFHITDAASSNLFADAIAAASRPFFGGTDIADGIDLAADLLLNNDFDGGRLVIDVSGDGSQTSGCFPLSCLERIQNSRDAAVAQGIVINGLPILDNPFSTLDQYYADNVVGGEGSFVLPASGFADFGQAVKEKIGREIQPTPTPTPSPTPTPTPTPSPTPTPTPSPTPTSTPTPNPTGVPEPTTLLGLLALGAIGLGAKLKQKFSA